MASPANAGASPAYEVIYCPPGEDAMGEPGDCALIEGDAWQSRIVRLVDGSRFSHTVSFVQSPFVADAQAYGVVRTHIGYYRDLPYVLVRLDASPEDRAQMQAFLQSVLDERWGYGWATFLAAGVSALSGYRLSVGLAETAICSGLAASTMTRMGMIWPVPPASMTPRMLAEHFDAL